MVIQWIKNFFKEVGDIMAKVYATLIIKGSEVYQDVPSLLKDKVKQILIDLECEELIQE